VPGDGCTAGAPPEGRDREVVDGASAAAALEERLMSEGNGAEPGSKEKGPEEEKAKGEGVRDGPEEVKEGCWGMGKQLAERERRFVAAVVEPRRRTGTSLRSAWRRSANLNCSK
jgi:hypothetical protein